MVECECDTSRIRAKVWSSTYTLLDLFLKEIDIKEWRDLGLLLENEDGLIYDWVVVRRACEQFDKRRQWDNEPTMGTISLIGKQPRNEGQ